jgi:NIMA (never in mitosis gene a)-related kinase
LLNPYKGEGAYSSVYKVKRNSDKEDYALKKVSLADLSQKEKENALNEVRILASIRNPNIIGYKETFIDERSNSMWYFINFRCGGNVVSIIMEFADNGDLYQKIATHQKQRKLFKESEIWNIFLQIVAGMKALHDLKIYHRDLKVFLH